jgi:hypothetical protein
MPPFSTKYPWSVVVDGVDVEPTVNVDVPSNVMLLAKISVKLAINADNMLDTERLLLTVLVPVLEALPTTMLPSSFAENVLAPFSFLIDNALIDNVDDEVVPRVLTVNLPDVVVASVDVPVTVKLVVNKSVNTATNEERILVMFRLDQIVDVPVVLALPITALPRSFTRNVEDPAKFLV